MKRLILAALVMALIPVSACSRKESGPSHLAMIREALTRLLARPRGAFLIIEEPKSGKFVQFAGSKEEELLLDLPSQALSDDEMAKAKEAFAELGYPGPETFEVLEYPGGPPAGTQTSFQVKFGKDIEKAAKLAVVVLHKVYGFNDNTQLELTEE